MSRMELNGAMSWASDGAGFQHKKNPDRTSNIEQQLQADLALCMSQLDPHHTGKVLIGPWVSWLR